MTQDMIDPTMTLPLQRVKPQELCLRKTLESDALRIWQWRNDPEVRAISFATERIDWEDHQNWVREKLADPKCLWLVASHEEWGTVGHVRFDMGTDATALIAITIAPELRGRGIGKALISRSAEEAFSQLPVQKIVAQIKPHNSASDRAFRQAGFQPIAPTTINGVVSHQLCLIREM